MHACIQPQNNNYCSAYTMSVTYHSLRLWRKQCSVCDQLWTLWLTWHTRPHPPLASTWTSPDRGSEAAQQWLNRQPAWYRRVKEIEDSHSIYLVLISVNPKCKHKLGSEHTTTQHTVNVVTHVPQRPVNEKDTTKKIYAVHFGWLL